MKEDILKSVQEYAKLDASIYGDLLLLIGKNWQEMAEAQKRKRSEDNLKSLSEMLNNLWYLTLWRKSKPKLWDSVQCCTLIDALDSVMPEAKGSSEAQRALLSHFAKSCRALGWKPSDNFIRDTRDKESFLKLLYKNFPETKKEG